MRVREDEGSGTPVVLLHGQPGTAAEWSRIVPLLAGNDLRVLTVDRPGYGEDPEPARDWAGNVEALLAMFDERGIDDAIVVGYSWAGGVALEAALAAPDRVRGLVLVGSVGHPSALTRSDRVLAFRPVNRQLSRVMNGIGSRAVTVLKAVSGSAVDEDGASLLADEAAQFKASGAWESFALEQDYFVRDARGLAKRLRDVTTPAVLLHGWKDDVVPLKAGGALAAALPDARLQVVDGGHLLYLEHPEAVANTIVAFARWLG